MNLLGLLPNVLRAVGKVLGIDVVKQAGDALAGATLSPEQQVAVQQALAQHEEKLRELGIKELKTALSENLAMIASPDRFVSRARPTMLYVATGITALLSVIIGITIFRAVHIDLGAIGAITS